MGRKSLKTRISPLAYQQACALCDKFAEENPVPNPRPKGYMREYKARFSQLVSDVLEAMPHDLKKELDVIKVFCKTQLAQLRPAKDQPKMLPSASGAAGTKRPPTVLQARQERRHAPEKYALNVTGQRLVERADAHNAVYNPVWNPVNNPINSPIYGPIYRAKIKSAHNKAMLVRSRQRSQEFVMCVTGV